MDYITQLLKFLPNPSNLLHTSTDTVKSTPVYLLSVILQPIFFTLTLTTLLTIILKCVFKFSYFWIADMKIIRIALIGLFGYFKIYVFNGLRSHHNNIDNNNQQLSISHSLIYLLLHHSKSILAYFASIFLSIYIYDSCMTISQYYTSKIRGLYPVQVILFSTMCIILPLYYISQHQHSQQQYQHQHYTYILLTLSCAIIVLINLLHWRHFVYTGVLCGVMLGSVLLRGLFNGSIMTRGLPLGILPVVMMAFDAQYKQYKNNNVTVNNNNNANNNNQHNNSDRTMFMLLKLSVYYIIYYELSEISLTKSQKYIINSNNHIHIEYCIVIVAVIAQIVTFVRGRGRGWKVNKNQ